MSGLHGQADVPATLTGLHDIFTPSGGEIRHKAGMGRSLLLQCTNRYKTQGVSWYGFDIACGIIDFEIQGELQ
ncbi:hypothetical protein [Chromobacterium vaccinii]|uniref:hypothetical protein n=1 Tax=Chromobacterium vaccinii TaxID=1108595 RepID=UPI0011866A09|nr:hypothetical protein [Chromobacterium vaccinii]